MYDSAINDASFMLSAVVEFQVMGPIAQIIGSSDSEQSWTSKSDTEGVKQWKQGQYWYYLRTT